MSRFSAFYVQDRKAVFNEDVIFTTTIPIPNVNDLKLKEKTTTTPHDATPDDGVTPDDTTPDDDVTAHDAITPQVWKLLELLKKEGEMSSEELLLKMELKDREHLRKKYLKPALELGVIQLTLPDKIRSKKQKYRLIKK